MNAVELRKYGILRLRNLASKYKQFRITLTTVQYHRYFILKDHLCGSNVYILHKKLPLVFDISSYM
jgi:hypothetical protein